MPIDPFGLLGSAIANVVTDSLTAAMLALWNAGLWVLRAVLELEDAILTPSLRHAPGKQGAEPGDVGGGQVGGMHLQLVHREASLRRLSASQGVGLS